MILVAIRALGHIVPSEKHSQSLIIRNHVNKAQRNVHKTKKIISKRKSTLIETPPHIIYKSTVKFLLNGPAQIKCYALREFNRNFTVYQVV